MYKALKLSIASMFVLSACTSGQVSSTHSMDSATPEADPTPIEVSVEETSTNVDVASNTQEATPSVLLAKSPAQYIDYSRDTLEEYEGTKPVALFFHADWCPTCLGVEKELKANLSSLPDGATIMEVNFDTERALKQKYGVTVQTTFVVLDGSGEVTEVLAAPSSRELAASFNKVL